MFFNHKTKMEHDTHVPDIVSGQKKKGSKKKWILGGIASALLIVAIVFGATSNFFGAFGLGKGISITLPSGLTPISVESGEDTVLLGSFDFTGPSAGKSILKQVILTGYLDEDGDGDYSTTEDNSVALYDLIDDFWAETGDGNALGTPYTVDATASTVTFTGLGLEIEAGATQTMNIYGTLSSSAPGNSDSDFIAFDIDLPRDDAYAINPLGTEVLVKGKDTNGTEDSPNYYVEIAGEVFSIDDVCTDYEEFSEDNIFCYDDGCHYNTEGAVVCAEDYCPAFNISSSTLSSGYFYCNTDTCYYDVENPGEYYTETAYSDGCRKENYLFWSTYCTNYTLIDENSIDCNDSCIYYSDGTSECFDWSVYCDGDYTASGETITCDDGCSYDMDGADWCDLGSFVDNYSSHSACELQSDGSYYCADYAYYFDDYYYVDWYSTYYCYDGRSGSGTTASGSYCSEEEDYEWDYYDDGSDSTDDGYYDEYGYYHEGGDSGTGSSGTGS